MRTELAFRMSLAGTWGMLYPAKCPLEDFVHDSELGLEVSWEMMLGRTMDEMQRRQAEGGCR